MSPTHDPAVRLQQFATRLIRIARSSHKDYNISSAQYSAMALLDAFPGLTIVEMARREAVSHPTMSRIVGGLEKLDLVYGTADPNDRRARRLSLTASGDTLYREIAERRIALFRELLAQLRPETVAEVLQVVERLAGPLEEHFRKS